MLEIYRYKDLKNAGFGSRNTIKSKMAKGDFPQPSFDDGEGHACWTREVIQDWIATRKPYIQALPRHLQTAAA